MYDGVGEVQREEECRQHSWRHIQRRPGGGERDTTKVHEQSK